MVFDLLTEQDKQLINNYRRNYGYSECRDFCDIEKFLTPWNKAKSNYLESIFKDSLIIEFPIEYTDNSKTIQKNINKFFTDSDINLFYTELSKFLEENCIIEETDSPTPFYYNLGFNPFDYISIHSNNKIPYFFHLKFKDGSIMKIQKDSKPMRVIIKIAQKFKLGLRPAEHKIHGKEVTLLEYCRLKHSLIFNQKKIKGTMCLSIHPLDYITMSDNADGWSSCMSWDHTGEYRQGTVEMMNSSSVVVGYLKSEKEYDGWNSKKWRSLFIVDPDFIVSIKGYPYQNDYLTKACIQKLSIMSNWGEPNINKFINHRENIIEDRKIDISFWTNDYAMYNDFGTTDHFIMLDPKDKEDIFIDEYFYPGESECIWCGDIDFNLIGPSKGTECLTCDICEPKARYCCDRCGADITSEEIYTTEDGYELCEWCYDNDTLNDFITGYVYYSNYETFCIFSNSGYKKTIYLSFDTLDNKNLIKEYFTCELPNNHHIQLNQLTFKGLYSLGISKQELLNAGIDYLTPEQFEKFPD